MTETMRAPWQSHLLFQQPQRHEDVQGLNTVHVKADSAVVTLCCPLFSELAAQLCGELGVNNRAICVVQHPSDALE